MKQKNTLNSYAVRNFSHGKSGIRHIAASADHNPLKCLNPLFFTFFYFNMDLDRIPRIKCGNVKPHHFTFYNFHFSHLVFSFQNLFSLLTLHFSLLTPITLSNMTETADRTDR